MFRYSVKPRGAAKAGREGRGRIRMRRVAVLIESSRAYGRGLLRGVARYNREHGHWSVYIQPHGLDDPPPPWLKRWRGDGILVRIGDRRMLRAVLGSGLPTVDLRGVV